MRLKFAPGRRLRVFLNTFVEWLAVFAMFTAIVLAVWAAGALVLTGALQPVPLFVTVIWGGGIAAVVLFAAALEAIMLDDGDEHGGTLLFPAWLRPFK